MCANGRGPPSEAAAGMSTFCSGAQPQGSFTHPITRISPLCWRPSHILNAQVGSCSLLKGVVKHIDSKQRLPDPNIQTVGLPFTKSFDFEQMTDLLHASVSSPVMG